MFRKAWWYYLEPLFLLAWVIPYALIRCLVGKPMVRYDGPIK